MFVDHNHYQVDGPVSEVMGLEPLADKWRAFGWYTEEINGHDYDEILSFLARLQLGQERPSVAIANTQKGHGVSFMMGNQYHARVLTTEEAKRALAELDAKAADQVAEG